MRIIGWILAILLLASFAVGAVLLNKRYEAFTSELTQCRVDRDDQRALAERAVRDRDIERAARVDIHKLANDARADLHATRTEVEELRQQRAQTEAQLSAFRTVQSKLQSMIDTGKLKVFIRHGKMIVKLPAEVLFASGKAELSTEGQTAIAEVAKVLKEFRDRRFMVAGHTDNLPVGEGEYRNNWDLSAARALTVTESLIKSGLRPQNLIAAGYGEYDPVASNGTPAGRQENRRIELVLQPNLDELPKLLDETKVAKGEEQPTSQAAAPPQ